MHELAGNLPVEYTTELKLDGLSVALHYGPAADGGATLLTGVTRGDGQIGEDVTTNVRTIRSVPISVSAAALKKAGISPHGREPVRGGAGVPAAFEVRGEVVMPEKAFVRTNEEREREGLPASVNPRNCGGGDAAHAGAKYCGAARAGFLCVFSADRGRVFCSGTGCNAGCTDGVGISRESASRARAHGGGDDEVHPQAGEQRDTLGYEIDGVVLKVDAQATQQRLGYTGRAPRWAIAYKFTAEQAITQMDDIMITVGRSGKLTPTAMLKPVFVGGATISRATLHNADWIERMGLRIGDWVKVERGGDVIPKVAEIVEDAEHPRGTQTVSCIPCKCPECGNAWCAKRARPTIAA